MMRKHGDTATQRATDEARDWLEGSDGYPRSRLQERINAGRRDHELYDEDEAPPIAGYEVLEREGYAVRIGPVNVRGQQRIHFKKQETDHV